MALDFGEFDTNKNYGRKLDFGEFDRLPEERQTQCTKNGSFGLISECQNRQKSRAEAYR